MTKRPGGKGDHLRLVADPVRVESGPAALSIPPELEEQAVQRVYEILRDHQLGPNPQPAVVEAMRTNHLQLARLQVLRVWRAQPANPVEAARFLEAVAQAAHTLNGRTAAFVQGLTQRPSKKD